MKYRSSGVALAATAALAAVSMFGAGPGQAADVAVKTPVVKAAAPYNWTGCYAGGYVGWAAANDWTTTDLNGYNPAGVNPWDFTVGNQTIGGGTLGCNWQAASWLVLGVEGEGGYLNVAGSAPQNLLVVPPGGGFSSVSTAAKFGTGYGLIAGRAGWTYDRLMIYGKVGVAFYESSATVTDSANAALVATGSRSQSPFAVGAGGEYAIYDHWSGKAEYVYFDRGSAFNVSSGPFSWKQDPSAIHTFKVGLNYKFW
jgi:outer membrane immunogenic protein